ncbi:MAG: hypothetical protein KF900_13820 [Bacteroidetes bacterium]|nr:hypothetical protein [Bacteroidota bacterium]
MNILRNNKIYKSICLFFVLLILNTSIDTPDMLVFNTSENEVATAEINDIETLAELLLEDFFDIEDAIPEEEEPDNQSHGVNLFAKLTFYHQPTINKSLIDTNPLNNKNDISALYKEPIYASQFVEVSTPPPKA